MSFSIGSALIVHVATRQAKSTEMLYQSMIKHCQDVSIVSIGSEADLVNILHAKPDIVLVNAISMPETLAGSSTTSLVADFLELHNISYTGSAPKALAIGLDKEQSKLAIARKHLPTAPHISSADRKFAVAADIPIAFPLFVKPLNKGNGAGIDENSVVTNIISLNRKIKLINEEFGSPALIESYLDGREFSVALLGQGYDESLLAMPIEIIPSANRYGQRLLSGAVKSDDLEITRPITNSSLKLKLMELGKHCFAALGARDYGRLDFRMDSTGELQFLEANLKPGLAKGYFYRAYNINTGLDYDSMVENIINTSVARATASQVQV